MADRVQVPAEIVLAVWQAEDGRCEACGRPMDRHWAKVARVDDALPRTADNLHLLCADCKARRPDQLKTRKLVLGEAVAGWVLGQLPAEQLGGATQWVAGQLQRYGVIVRLAKDGRSYWLPGVGTFHLQFPDETTAVVERVDHLAEQREVRTKPQERTRGLPRPDRRPLQRAGTATPGAGDGPR